MLQHREALQWMRLGLSMVERTRAGLRDIMDSRLGRSMATGVWDMLRHDEHRRARAFWLRARALFTCAHVRA